MEIKPPTQKEVDALVRKTGESPRKCYFWLVQEAKEKAEAAQRSQHPSVLTPSPIQGEGETAQ